MTEWQKIIEPITQHSAFMPLLLLFAVLLMTGLGWLLGRSRAEQQLKALEQHYAVEHSRLEERCARIPELEAELDAQAESLANARQNLGRLQGSLDEAKLAADDKLQTIQQMREQMVMQFKQLSSEILEDKSKRFGEQNREKLDQLLQPLKDNIHRFEQQVASTFKQDSDDRSALREQLKQLRALNQQVHEDTLNLTTALKGQSKTQGNWGEMILERVLEQSGLEKGREYETQVAHSSEHGRRLPDAVVHLPDGRDVVVDAKVALVAYEQYSSAEDDSLRAAALKRHVQAIRTHIKQLAAKQYHDLDGLNSLDFVLMFVPIEAALVEALRADESLQNEALKANIALVSPFTLLPALRTVENLWKFDRQNRNAAKVAAEAGKMYDKFVGFVDDLQEVGRRLNQAQAAQLAAEKKLSTGTGDLITRAEKLRKLGAEANKQLPESLRDAAELASSPD